MFTFVEESLLISFSVRFDLSSFYSRFTSKQCNVCLYFQLTTHIQECNPETSLSLRALDSAKLQVEANLFILTTNSDTLALSMWCSPELVSFSNNNGSRFIVSLQKLRQPCNRLCIRIVWIAQILQQLVSIWTANSQKNIHFFVIVDVTAATYASNRLA